MSAFSTSINTVSYILNLNFVTHCIQPSTTLYTLYTTLYNRSPNTHAYGVHQAVVVRAVVARAVARAVAAKVVVVTVEEATT